MRFGKESYNIIVLCNTMDSMQMSGFWIFQKHNIFEGMSKVAC